MKHFILLLFLSMLFVCSFGCKKNPHGVTMVTGIVTIDDQPLDAATIVFHPPEGNQSASGRTDAQGQFTVTTGSSDGGTGAQPGHYQVSVTKMGLSPLGEQLEAEALREGREFYSIPHTISLIPQKYNNPATSGFEATVEKGQKNHFEFKLERK